MTNPRRLSLEDENGLEAVLLRAGRAGAPSGAKRRALLLASGAGAASGLAATGAAAEGSAGLAAKAGSLTALKWLGVLSVTGASALGGVVGLEHATGRSAGKGSVATAPATPSHVPPHARPAGSSPGDAPEPLSDPGAPIADSPTAAPVAPASTVSTLATATAETAVSPPRARASAPLATKRSTVPAELALLDQARVSMDTGDTGRALSLLDGYAARFPRGHMTPEATVLRIEALVQAGDEARATRLARAFLEGAPDTPYAARIRSLLARTNP